MEQQVQQQQPPPQIQIDKEYAAKMSASSRRSGFNYHHPR